MLEPLDVYGNKSSLARWLSGQAEAMSRAGGRGSLSMHGLAQGGIGKSAAAGHTNLDGNSHLTSWTLRFLRYRHRRRRPRRAAQTAPISLT